MNGTGKDTAGSRQWQAYALVALLAIAAFSVATLVPYRVGSDTGFQLRGLQQWLRGESPSPGTLRLPDADDLSRDALVWSSWWPPGFPFLYAPLAAMKSMGLSLAGALRLTSLLFFLLGAFGWLRFADGLQLSRPARLLYAASLAVYALTTCGAASLRSADNLSFAFAPWLALFVLRQASNPRWLALAGTGALLGLGYWVKYTLFLAALSLGGWLALQLATARQGAWTTKARQLTALGLGLLLSVLAMVVLHTWQSGTVSESATGARTLWQAEDPRPARPLPIALGFLGAPGLGLFQSHIWINHLLFFSDRIIPVLRPLDTYHRLLLASAAGVVGTAALLWTLRRSRSGNRAFSLAVTATGVFFVLLAAASVMIRYNYLANEPRYSMAVMPLLHPIVLAAWLAAFGRTSRSGVRVMAAVALALFFLMPGAFAAVDFAANEIGDRLAFRPIPSVTGLWAPEISERDLPRVWSSVAALLRSPRDIVVVAAPAGTGESFLMWLEVPGRVLPITTFSLPLGGSYLRAADLRDTGPLTSSLPLRVVLVTSCSLEEGGWRARLQARFPQAQTWTQAPPVPGANVVIRYGDLLPTPQP